MAYELTVEDKQSIINNQLRNVAYRKYAYEVELIVENAAATPSAAKISELNAEITQCGSQITALTTELESLS